jgi:hypothetical protein
MEQKKFYSHKPYSHNLPYRFFGTVSVHFGLFLSKVVNRQGKGATTLSKMTFSLTTLSITTFSIMTLSITFK